MNSLTLKWGTVKAWDLETDAAREAFRKWADFGVSISCLGHRDKPGQREALLAAIDHMDKIYLDWEDKIVDREGAKEYLREYWKRNDG